MKAIKVQLGVAAYHPGSKHGNEIRTVSKCSFKYGMYENVRWNTQEMLSRLLIEI